MAKTVEKNRWYDQDPSVAAAIDVLLAMPEEIRVAICKGVVMLAEKEFKANELAKQVKSLGTDKVLGMFKAKKKQRYYDTNETLHRMMLYMFLLSEENRRYIARSIGEMKALITDYLGLCKQYSASTDQYALNSLTETYGTHGSTEAKKLLSKFERAFVARIQKTGPKTPDSPPPSEKKDVSITDRVKDTGEELKIQLDNSG